VEQVIQLSRVRGTSSRDATGIEMRKDVKQEDSNEGGCKVVYYLLNDLDSAL